MPPSSQILNSGPIFHQAGGLLGITPRINPHKDMEGLDPCVNGRYPLSLI